MQPEFHSPRSVGPWILFGITAVGPWLNGGADVLPQWILFFLGTVVAAWWIRDLWRGGHNAFLSWCGLATIGGIFLALFHLAPIWSIDPAATVPRAVQLRSELTTHGDVDRTLSQDASVARLNPAGDDLPSHVALTLDPHATRQTLAILILSLTVFMASTLWVRHSERLVVLMTWWSWNGVALTIFAVLAKATWNGKLYWCIPIGFTRGVFGPMIYHNLAGNLLMMTTAAAFFVMIYPKPIRSTVTGQHRELKRGGWHWPDAQTITQWLVLIANVAGLLLTLSRGALLASLIAAFITLVLIRPKKGWRAFALPLGVALCGALGLVAWFRATDAVSQRYSTLMESERLLEDVRLDHWQDGARAGQVYGVCGVGLGAYRHIHLMFQDGEIERSFLRAHNQYLETWVDGGIPGLLLLAIALGCAFGLLFWLGRRRDPKLRAVAALGMLVLFGQMAHAMLDFCLYLPATAIMFATLLGAISGVAQQAAAERKLTTTGIGLQLPRGIGRLVALVTFAGAVWGTWVGARWAREEALLYSVPWDSSNQDIPILPVRNAIDELSEFAAGTDDWRVPLALGELTMADYRHRLADELIDELQQQSENDLTLEQLWQFTDPLVLNARTHVLAAENKMEAIESEVLARPLIAGPLARSHAYFRAARRLSPTVAQVHLRLAELSFLRATPDYSDMRDLERVERLAVGNADLMFEVGRRYATAGFEARALAAWKASLVLSPRHWQAVYALVGTRLTPTQMLDELLPADPKLILSVAGKQFTEPEQRGTRERFLARSDALMGTEPPANLQRAAQWHLNRAELELLREQRPKAIAHVATAVRLRPEDHALRAQLAQLLALEKRWDEALQEIRYSLGLQPNNWDYRGLFERINKERTAVNASTESP